MGILGLLPLLPAFLHDSLFLHELHNFLLCSTLGFFVVSCLSASCRAWEYFYWEVPYLSYIKVLGFHCPETIWKIISWLGVSWTRCINSDPTFLHGASVWFLSLMSDYLPHLRPYLGSEGRRQVLVTFLGWWIKII